MEVIFTRWPTVSSDGIFTIFLTGRRYLTQRMAECEFIAWGWAKPILTAPQQLRRQRHVAKAQPYSRLWEYFHSSRGFHSCSGSRWTRKGLCQDHIEKEVHRARCYVSSSVLRWLKVLLFRRFDVRHMPQGCAWVLEHIRAVFIMSCWISTWPAIWEVKGTDWPTGVRRIEALPLQN